jgi:hypothetical protein
MEITCNSKKIMTGKMWIFFEIFRDETKFKVETLLTSATVKQFSQYNLKLY